MRSSRYLLLGLLLVVAAAEAFAMWSSPSASGAAARSRSPFDDDAGVVHLDRLLLRSLRTAAIAAEADGVTISVNSGWRSAEDQRRLQREAVARYGSEEEAARWVASPETSAHVSGDAVDIGGADATRWLADHGAAFGLCRIYDNEPWHFERRPEATEHGCPPTYPDPTRDPRLHPYGVATRLNG